MYQAPPATQLSELYARPAEKPDTFAPGRPCAVPSCITTLSVYNVGPCCWACGGKAEDRIDTKPTAEALVELMETV